MSYLILVTRAAIITILSVLPGLRAEANFALRKTKPTLSEMNKKLLILAVAACLGLPSASAAATALALTLADGSMAAVQLQDYQSPTGTKCCLTINYRYPL